ncbi:MAG: ATP-binding protein, partial [Chloroflexota bacterium]|nr:ATP-binding protein [Chloroflexota bacterium]
LNDITSSKQVEKLKDEFVSIVSHELRTPLTGIKGYTQYVMRRIERRIRAIRKAEPELRIEDMPESVDVRNLTIVQSQTEQLERLVNGLLDLSRVQWGKLYLHYTSFYLADLLTEQVNSVQASAEQHSIQLTIVAQDTKIVADPQRIGQAIGNILDNAIKYSPQGGQVTVKLEKRGDEYLISITDQGQGVSQEQRDHVFERFYRVHNTTNRPSAGIGLGMYVTRAIVEEHGGRIWFTDNLVSGTTFYVALPQVPSQARKNMDGAQ